MSDYITFDARIEAVKWGKATYTVLRLPTDVATRLGPAKRVEGEFNEHPVNFAISKSPVIDGPFLWTGKTTLDKIGVSPGEVFEARLRPANPNLVEVPGDVTNALRSSGVLDIWDSLSAGKKRGHLYPIEAAKRPETRVKRISKLIEALRELGS